MTTEPARPREPASPDERRTAERAAELLPEERAAGSDAPAAQAAAVLADSEARQAARNAAPDSVVEHRRSHTVDDTDG